MLARRISNGLYNTLLVLQIITGFAAVVLGGFQKASPESFAEFSIAAPVVSSGLAALHSATWWLVPLLLMASGVLGLVKKWVGPPWLWRTVHSYLDTFRKDVFTIGPDDAVHHHRVTLFRHVGWCWRPVKWPWSGWLIPVERSGHTTQSKISIFRAPDDADRAQGIAGMAWARGAIVRVSELPDLEADPSDEAFRSYSKATGMTEAELRRKVPKARSFCGIPVEVKGNLWGVIVLDSRSPEGINKDSQVLYRPLGTYLGKLLERV